MSIYIFFITLSLYILHVDRGSSALVYIVQNVKRLHSGGSLSLLYTPTTFPEVSAAPGASVLARMHAGGVTPAGVRDLGTALGVDASQLVRAIISFTNLQNSAKTSPTCPPKYLSAERTGVFNNRG